MTENLMVLVTARLLIKMNFLHLRRHLNYDSSVVTKESVWKKNNFEQSNMGKH